MSERNIRLFRYLWSPKTHRTSSKKCILDCVFSHFAESDQCPSCGAKPLGEQDFTELVVSDSTLAPNLLKTCFQTILCTRPNSNAITFPEACSSILRQMEAMKTTTKFLLKQMIKDSASKGQMHQGYAALKQQCIDQKQQIASMQDCHQRALNEVNNKLHNKEKANAELQQQLHAYRRSAAPSQADIQVPSSRAGGPPLQGILAQKQQREANARAQQEAMLAGRMSMNSHLRMSAPPPGSSVGHGSGGLGPYAASSPMIQQAPIQRSNSYPEGGGAIRASRPAHQQMHQNVTPIQNMATARPYTSNSNGSGNRIRGLTATSGYHFTSTALSGSGSAGHINKRRHGTPTGSSLGNSPGGRYGVQPYPHPIRGGKENPYR